MEGKGNRRKRKYKIDVAMMKYRSDAIEESFFIHELKEREKEGRENTCFFALKTLQ